MAKVQFSSPNFVYLDWAREVLPRSIGVDKISSHDGNPYHYGLEPRLQFLRMLAEVVQTNISPRDQKMVIVQEDI